jgi:hypothetical protein
MSREGFLIRSLFELHLEPATQMRTRSNVSVDISFSDGTGVRAAEYLAAQASVHGVCMAHTACIARSACTHGCSMHSVVACLHALSLNLTPYWKRNCKTGHALIATTHPPTHPPTRPPAQASVHSALHPLTLVLKAFLKVAAFGYFRSRLVTIGCFRLL